MKYLLMQKNRHDPDAVWSARTGYPHDAVMAEKHLAAALRQVAANTYDFTLWPLVDNLPAHGHVLVVAAEEADTIKFWLRHAADIARGTAPFAGEANATIEGINSILVQLGAEPEKGVVA